MREPDTCGMTEEKDYSSLVDPFWGHGAIQTLETTGMVEFNHKKLTEMRIPVRELEQGGELKFYLK